MAQLFATKAGAPLNIGSAERAQRYIFGSNAAPGPLGLEPSNEGAVLYRRKLF